MGFAETSYQTAYESPTGEYGIKVYLVRNGKRDTAARRDLRHGERVPARSDEDRVASFQGAEVRLDHARTESTAAMTLRNLYGTPATARRIKSHLVAVARGFAFRRIRRLHVSTIGCPTTEKEAEAPGGGSRRDEDRRAGRRRLSIWSWSALPTPLTRMTFYVEGFEADGGRSVGDQQLAAGLPAALRHRRQDRTATSAMSRWAAQRAVEWIALDPALKKIARRRTWSAG